MSRKRHIEFPGAIYYLQLNGNGHRRLFSEHRECERFRRLLSPLSAESGGAILGYCLLPDSVHLVLKSAADGNASAAQMGRWLVHHYTEYYNRIHNRNGSVFLQHVSSVLIEPNRYLLPVIHQLHNLPVVEGLVPLPSAYPWSSHRDYLSFEPPPWLDRGEVFHRIANQRAMQVRRYEHFIEESQQPVLDWIAGTHPTFRALASDQYLRRLLSSARQHQPAPIVDLETLTEWVCGEYGLEPQDLALWRRHRLAHEVRGLVAVLAVDTGCADLQAMAAFFQCDPELLETGMRAVEAHRRMYLFRLRSQLNRWLNQTTAEDADDLPPVPADSHGYDDGAVIAEAARDFAEADSDDGDENFTQLAGLNHLPCANPNQDDELRVNAQPVGELQQTLDPPKAQRRLSL